MKKLFSYRLSFFVLAIILFWAKTYLAYHAEFNLGVKGPTQAVSACDQSVLKRHFLFRTGIVCERPQISDYHGDY